MEPSLMNSAWWCHQCSKWVNIQNAHTRETKMLIYAECVLCEDSVGTELIEWPEAGPRPPKAIPTDAQFVQALISGPLFGDKKDLRVVDYTGDKRGVFARLLKKSDSILDWFTPNDSEGGLWVWKGWIWWDAYRYFEPMLGEFEIITADVRLASEYEARNFSLGVRLGE